jgi:hypothetical protein
MQEFSLTRRGARFFDGTLPKIARALTTLAEVLTKTPQWEACVTFRDEVPDGPNWEPVNMADTNRGPQILWRRKINGN